MHQNTLLWVLSAIIVFVSLGAFLSADTLSGIAVVLLALVLNPFVIKLVTARFRAFDKAWFRAIACVLCFLTIALTASPSKEKIEAVGASSEVSSDVSSEPPPSSEVSSEPLPSSDVSSEPVVSSSVSSEGSGEYISKDDKLLVGESTDPVLMTLNELKKQGFTHDEALEMQAIFYSIGVNSVCDIKPAAGQGIDVLQAFLSTANVGKEKFHFTVENRKLFYAGFAGTDLYDSDLGGVLGDISDVEMPQTEISLGIESGLIIKSKEIVRTYLNYPDTAKFDAFGWMLSRWNEKYYVSGSVSAKNAFGVKDTLDFSLSFTITDTATTVDEISIY